MVHINSIICVCVYVRSFSCLRFFFFCLNFFSFACKYSNMRADVVNSWPDVCFICANSNHLSRQRLSDYIFEYIFYGDKEKNIIIENSLCKMNETKLFKLVTFLLGSLSRCFFLARSSLEGFNSKLSVEITYTHTGDCLARIVIMGC